MLLLLLLLYNAALFVIVALLALPATELDQWGLQEDETSTMGSNAQRKTSSRSLNLDGYGGAGPKSMKRQKLLAGSPGAASWDSAEGSVLEPKIKKRFVGVRQRPSGRWVAEIKDTTQKIRLWLGTFDSAEEGAKAYDSAARALRGANTRTNFVPAIACEGTVPATTSKAARLIRLRQIAAANSKACEKLGHGANQVISPLLRQDLNQQSISSDLDRLPRSSGNEDECHSHVTTPRRLMSSSPLKPSRQIGRRHNASPLASSAKSEQEGTAPLLASAEDNGPELDSLIYSSPLKLALQQSGITSENLSNAINHSLTSAASPQAHHISSLTRLPLDKCNQPNSTTTPSTSADEEPPLLHNLVELAATDIHLKCEAVDDGSEKHRLEPPPLENSSVSAFTVEKNLMASPPKQQSFPCSSNRADVSLYATSASYGDDNEGLIFTGIDSNSTVSFDDGRTSCKVDAESPLQSCASTGAASTSTILREKELHCSGSEQLLLAPDTIPWPDYVLVDGLDLTSCETNCGVYTSAFDFSSEAMDRDSCTSRVLLEDQQYLSDNSTEFLLSMPEASPLPGPPPSSPEPRDDAQSSGSTDTMDVDGGGEFSSPEQALWSSMDLAPLCMVS